MHIEGIDEEKKEGKRGNEEEGTRRPTSVREHESER